MAKLKKDGNHKKSLIFPANRISRRTFMKQTAAVSIGAGLGLPLSTHSKDAGSEPIPSLAGIQIQPHNLLDEGVELCLDLLQETAAVNTLFLLSHGYYVARGRAPAVLADDHGWTVRDERTRKLPKVWIRHHEKYYQDTSLRHYQNKKEEEYWNVDIFNNIQKTLRKRGMKIYARLYEPSRLALPDGSGLGWIKNWESVQTVDIFGQPGRGPCWNNPDYRAWIAATMTDMFSNYELDGLQYGAERVGPLSEVLYRGIVPACFCEYCIQRNQKQGIDAERAKQGYTELYQYITAAAEKNTLPPDGLMTTLIRTLLKYHEILAWYYQWFEAEQEILQMIYKTVKAIKPTAEVGWHIDHQRSTWDLFYRAAVSYQTMAHHADFIKPILYHEIMGPRMQGWVLADWTQRLFKELSAEQILHNFYALRGYDPKTEPGLDELMQRGFSPEYVYRETKRLVDGVSGLSKVYAGIGLDIPWNNEPFLSDPASVYQATLRAYAAGADGIVISREYDEMRVPGLKAVGRAVREKR